MQKQNVIENDSQCTVGITIGQTPTTVRNHACDYDTLCDKLDKELATASAFGMVMFPGEKRPYWFGTPYTNAGGMTLEIIPWLGKYADRIVIGGSNCDQSANGNLQPLPTATSKAQYMKGVAGVIESCKSRHGKTVYSRVMEGYMRMPGDIDQSLLSPGEIAVELFKEHLETLRFVFRTPSTGAWLGATPELLVHIDKKTGAFSTMAFAGTRRKGEDAPWDKKNIDENRFVTDYIVAALKRLGITPEISPARTVAYGNIEHLCVDITGECGKCNVDEIIDALNPTPALCGWPKEEAVADISRFEDHNRGCYGGVIGISTPMSYTAYVNLRSMRFENGRCAIFGGGGITPLSDPTSEFAETEAKTALLRSLTEKSNKSEQEML